MKTSPATPNRRTSGSASPGGRSVLLLVMIGLILLSMGWQAAHRYGRSVGDAARTLPHPSSQTPSHHESTKEPQL